MDLEVKLVNAQAFLDGNKKRVRLYGGLVRHRQIGVDGLAVALAHETGHHLAGAPYLPFHRWLSDEQRATEWALTTGLKRVFDAEHASRVAKRGMYQLHALGSV
jgi:hypothetical protein